MRLCAVLLLFWIPVAQAGERLTGPVVADVISVRDGDTLVVDAHIWPGQTIRVAVRVRGIDTPELRGKCDSEKVLAQKAKARAQVLVGSDRVQLRNIGGGKYYGRILADVGVGAGDLGAVLQREGLARPYRKRRLGWCSTEIAKR